MTLAYSLKPLKTKQRINIINRPILLSLRSFIFSRFWRYLKFSAVFVSFSDFIIEILHEVKLLLKLYI